MAEVDELQREHLLQTWVGEGGGRKKTVVIHVTSMSHPPALALSPCFTLQRSHCKYEFTISVLATCEVLNEMTDSDQSIFNNPLPSLVSPPSPLPSPSQVLSALYPLPWHQTREGCCLTVEAGDLVEGEGDLGDVSHLRVQRLERAEAVV